MIYTSGGFGANIPPSVGQVLFRLTDANMQSTSDQQFTKLFSERFCTIAYVYAVCKSGGSVTAAVGGIYNNSSKTGTTAVAASQVWAMTAPEKLVSATISNVILFENPIYLSLTSGAGATTLADFYIVGLPIPL